MKCTYHKISYKMLGSRKGVELILSPCLANESASRDIRSNYLCNLQAFVLVIRKSKFLFYLWCWSSLPFIAIRIFGFNRQITNYYAGCFVVWSRYVTKDWNFKIPIQTCVHCSTWPFWWTYDGQQCLNFVLAEQCSYTVCWFTWPEHSCDEMHNPRCFLLHLQQDTIFVTKSDTPSEDLVPNLTFPNFYSFPRQGARPLIITPFY